MLRVLASRPLRPAFLVAASLVSVASLAIAGAGWAGCGFDAAGTGLEAADGGDSSVVDDASGDVAADVLPDVDTRPPADGPTCNDGLKNGDETDFDCGGSRCAPCGAGRHCLTGLDCDTSLCVGGVCVGAGCSNGAKDGSETDIDCGGTKCPKCVDGKVCALATDCANGFCRPDTLLCATPTCSDGFRNGSESDVDCGGSCGKCVDGKKCGTSGDCANGFCNPTTLTCATPTCADGFKNGGETDVDCGGASACVRCPAGKACAANADCAPSWCSGGTCKRAISCKALLAAVPGLASGAYELDPDGAAPNPPLVAYCDMTTDGGGWTFYAHVNQDYDGSDFFEKNVGIYRADRVDDNTTYGLGSWILPYVGHTQTMVTIDGADAVAAAAAHKLLVLQYVAGAPAFNRGPVPCVGLGAGFEYRTTIVGPFAAGGNAAQCDGTYWYPSAPSGLLVLVTTAAGGLGVFWGSGLAGDGAWGHDSHWFVR